jgi:hypothetical protein
MSERLKLKKTGSKVRLSPFMFVLIIIVCIVIGYGIAFAAKDYILPKQNCVPEKDLQYFIDLSNEFQGSYASCLKDNWALKMLCDQQTAQVSNTTKIAPVSNGPSMIN